MDPDIGVYACSDGIPQIKRPCRLAGKILAVVALPHVHVVAVDVSVFGQTFVSINEDAATAAGLLQAGGVLLGNDRVAGNREILDRIRQDPVAVGDQREHADVIVLDDNLIPLNIAQADPVLPAAADLIVFHRDIAGDFGKIDRRRVEQAIGDGVQAQVERAVLNRHGAPRLESTDAFGVQSLNAAGHIAHRESTGNLAEPEARLP